MTFIWILLAVLTLPALLFALLSEGESFKDSERFFQDFSWKKVTKGFNDYMDEIRVRKVFRAPFFYLALASYIVMYGILFALSGYLIVAVFKFTWAKIKYIILEPETEENPNDIQN